MMSATIYVDKNQKKFCKYMTSLYPSFMKYNTSRDINVDFLE